MKVGIAYSLPPPKSKQPLEGPDDRFEEFDKIETVEAIADVIGGEGHEVVLLGDGRQFLTRVLADPPDFVFNIAEGEGVGRCREARVPAALEMLGIPYSGSDPLTLAACLDKSEAKVLLSESTSFDLPYGWSLDPEDHAGASKFFREIYDRESDKYRWYRHSERPTILILKPEFEGSSKGIRGKAIAESPEEALEIYEDLARNYQQRIIAEEFIDGEEWTVGFYGDACLIGLMKIFPKAESKHFVYSLEVKRDYANRVIYEAPPEASTELVERITRAATYACSTLKCRDLARIDFRIRDGIPYFIEANPLPGLAPGTSDLVILAQGYGISHADLIRKIFHTALARVGLS